MTDHCNMAESSKKVTFCLLLLLYINLRTSEVNKWQQVVRHILNQKTFGKPDFLIHSKPQSSIKWSQPRELLGPVPSVDKFRAFAKWIWTFIASDAENILGNPLKPSVHSRLCQRPVVPWVYFNPKSPQKDIIYYAYNYFLIIFVEFTSFMYNTQ